MVDMLFNGLNLALRIVLVIYFVRKYMVHRIVQSIYNEKRVISGLDEQYGQIKDSCGVVENNMKAEEQLYHELQVKFTLWGKTVEAEQQREQQKSSIRQQQQLVQVEKKQQYVQQRYIIEKELPELLQNTQQELHQKFQTDPKLGKLYITKVLRALHEQYL